MDVDKAIPSEGDAPGELKIKGQAALERRKSKWEAEGDDDDEDLNKKELEKRENELKEKALRNKVMRSRKRSR